MSGHSHYATIKRAKEAKDAARGNIFSKMARSLMIAAKSGGDPDMNYKLRFEIEKARSFGMPKENIERAIIKATTEAANIEEISYEGFGPGGISVIVDVATDNKNRSAQEMKNLFERAGGRLSGPGSVSYNFDNKGFLLVKKTDDVDLETLALIDAGAEDIEDSSDGLEIYVAPEKLGEIHKKITDLGYEVSLVELQRKPKNLQAVSDESTAGKAVKFLQDLEDNEDVQKVSSNLDIPDEIASKIQ